MSAAATNAPQQRADSEKEKTPPKRINVAVGPETIKALEAVIEREGVSLTEAVRRLIGYGEVVYRAVKQDGAEVLLKTGDSTKQVIIL
ncbi:ribbon-helix-helix protein, CopG family [Amycolatopsis sp. NPDC052450]|uniref:ribbon-helix-helix protein, CopG family n=1 Tax=Amycolatopsis sp. NPDC052450 TaxID=3363937 RepID=UPI0037C9DD93